MTGAATQPSGRPGRSFNPIRLIELRRLTGLSLRDFAARIDRTAEAVRQYEKGQKPSLETLERIGREFGVDIRSFFD